MKARGVSVSSLDCKHGASAAGATSIRRIYEFTSATVDFHFSCIDFLNL